ncbi:MAG TPA: TOMM precursor leader peptide-binding protein [Galbitalea sp.]|jgi:bacteriocin biosynthesis cyclodehydratase domain-containing protein|nr:TOMM precursor leader peptide-binding protein [Galbitalea sp.]
MVLKLDSRPAIVWRDPFSLQFGVEPVRAVLREVSTAEERMIAALGAGISRSGLTMIAQASGAGEREVASLLKRLAGLLLPAEEPQSNPRVAITGTGPTTEKIADALAIAGARVEVGSIPDASCDLGIAVAHYVLDPESYGFWLRRDLPHLPVIFGDDSVTIGPLVEPGTTACLYCLEHYRRDADPSWSAIASQLWGRRSESETPLASIEVAARVARMALRRLKGGRATAATSIRLEVATGRAVSRTWLPHPDCGCIGFASAVSLEGPPEIGSAREKGPPTTVAAVAALE